METAAKRGLYPPFEVTATQGEARQDMVQDKRRLEAELGRLWRDLGRRYKHFTFMTMCKFEKYHFVHNNKVFKV